MGPFLEYLKALLTIQGPNLNQPKNGSAMKCPNTLVGTQLAFSSWLPTTAVSESTVPGNQWNPHFQAEAGARTSVNSGSTELFVQSKIIKRPCFDAKHDSSCVTGNSTWKHGVVSPDFPGWFPLTGEVPSVDFALIRFP